MGRSKVYIAKYAIVIKEDIMSFELKCKWKFIRELKNTKSKILL